MAYRVITIVYTKRRISALEIAEQKKYLFICEHDVKIGDMIDSPTYVTPCQVIDVSCRHLEEPTNLDNGPQGLFKIGVLDLDLVIRSFDRNHLDNYQRMYNIEYNVVITHMDCSPYSDVIPVIFNFNKIDYIDIDKAMAYCFRYISLKNTYLGLGPESEIVLFNR